MKQKKILAITICIFGLVCILLGIFLGIQSTNFNQNNNDDIENEGDSIQPSPTPVNKISYNEAVSIAESLYKTQNNIVQVIEENDRYVIEVKNTDDTLQNKFYLDRETGTISDAGSIADIRGAMFFD